MNNIYSFFLFGSSDLSKIHLFAKDGQSSDTMKLTCMATGLYSKNTEISILKSGWSVAKGYPHDFLPNDDGTYQIRLSVDAKKSEIDDYGCEVNQGDQKTRLVAQWAKGEITLPGYAFQFTTELYRSECICTTKKTEELHFKCIPL